MISYPNTGFSTAMAIASLEAILIEDWQKTTDGKSERLERLVRRIEELNSADKAALIEMYREVDSIDEDPLQHDIAEEELDLNFGLAELDGIPILNLALFLHTLALAEYRIDDLLYMPRDLRFARLESHASSAGLRPDSFKRIYLSWHDRLRNRVVNSQTS